MWSTEKLFRNLIICIVFSFIEHSFHCTLPAITYTFHKNSISHLSSLDNIFSLYVKVIIAVMKQLDQLQKKPDESTGLESHEIALHLLYHLSFQANWELVACKFVL